MTPQTRPGDRARPSRRAALGLGLTLGATLGLGTAAAVAVSGCTPDNPLDDSPSEDRTPAADAVRHLAPDVAVAVEAVTLVRGAQAAVTSTGDLHAALVPRLAGLTAMHRAHLDAVVDAVPDGVDTTATGAPYVVPARPAAALTRLATTEQALHDGLVGLALRAQSGPFARLLGAMAAAVSQQLRGLAA